ncbi:MAG: diguanylate cyclase [Aminobacteriaceae bacterium]
MDHCGGVDFEKVVNSSPIVSLIWLPSDPDRPCFTSDAIRSFGYEPGELTSGSVRYVDLIHPEDRDVLPFETGAGDSRPKVYRIAASDGSWRWVLHRTSFIEGDANRPDETLWIISDITQHKDAHGELQKHESKLTAFIEALPAMLIVIDEDGRFIEVTGSSEGVSIVEKFVGKTVGESMPLEKASELMVPLARCIETGTPQIASYEIGIGGKRYFQETHISLMPGDVNGKRAVVCVAIDITARKELEEEIMLQNVQDPLDPASNRTRFNRAFFLALAEAQRTGSTLAFFLIDLDHFNLVNEAIGRDLADLLLKGVAQKLQNACRRGDIIFRMEGVNYYLILPKPGKRENISMVAERVLGAIRSASPQKEGAFKLTATIGISIFPDNGLDSKTLLRMAESALNIGKTAGGDCYRFYEPPTE